MDNPTQTAAPTESAISSVEDIGGSILDKPGTVEQRVPSWQEPSAKPPVEETQSSETEPEQAAEATEESLDTQPEAEAEAAEEESADELPSEQERDYSSTVYERYAKRMGKTLKDIEADPLLRNFVKSKIDTDVYVQQQRQELDKLRNRDEPTVEEEGEEEGVEAAPEQQPFTEEAFQSHLTQLEQVAKAVTHPKMAEAFARDYFKAWGIEKPTDEDMARAVPLAQTYAKYFVNMAQSILPMVLPQLMEQAYPGVNQNWEVSTYQNAWERVRGSDEAFAELPAYGTKDFQQLMEKVAEVAPDIEHMRFNDAQGRPLSRAANAAKQYQTAARIASQIRAKEQPVKPEMMKAAVEKGKAIQKASATKQVAGTITGAGQSKGQFATPKLKGSGLGILEAMEEANPKYWDEDKK